MTNDGRNLPQDTTLLIKHYTHSNNFTHNIRHYLPVFVEIFKAKDVKDADTGTTLRPLSDRPIYRHVDSVDDTNEHATIDTFHKRITDIS